MKLITPPQEPTSYRIITFRLECPLRIRSFSLITLKNPNKNSLEVSFIHAKF